MNFKAFPEIVPTDSNGILIPDESQDSLQSLSRALLAISQSIKASLDKQWMRIPLSKMASTNHLSIAFVNTLCFQNGHYFFL